VIIMAWISVLCVSVGFFAGGVVVASQLARELWRIRNELYRVRDQLLQVRLHAKDAILAMEKISETGGLNVYEQDEAGSGRWVADPYRRKFMVGVGVSPMRAILSVCKPPLISE
jgi:hypothetical protein